MGSIGGRSPERGQGLGARAKQASSELVYGETVRVEIRDYDHNARLVGRVFVGDTDVSLALVEAGLAWHYGRYASERSRRRKGEPVEPSWSA